MKVERLIEILQTVSPNAEVGCEIGDSPTLLVSDLFFIGENTKYEVEYVLTTPNDDKYCILMLKEKDRWYYDW